MYQDDRFTDGYIMGTNSNRNNGWGNGGDWGWFIILALLFGWGGNNYGGFGGGAGMTGYELGKVATTNDVASGFNNSTVLSSLGDLKLGQASLQQTLCQGFNGINTSVLTSANSLQAQISDCCCQTQRAIDGINYNMAKNTCDIVQSGKDNTQRIIDYLTGEKISSLQAENSLLTAQLSQNSQTATLLNAINRTPSPAYVVPNPFTGGYGYNGCGGCNSL